MDTLRKELTFDGGVNIRSDPHLLKSNEWLNLQNMWPYDNKFVGTRPSLLHEQDIMPVPLANWNANLFYNSPAINPTEVRYYAQWFRHLTPLKAVFMGALDRVAIICVCNVANKVTLRERFEGEDEVLVDLQDGDVVLLIMPNDIGTVAGTKEQYPVLSGVRLGRTTNITPSLISFNGDIIAANKSCNYVVRVVKASTLPLPTATVWPNIDYRFTKVNFGDTNLDFVTDGVVLYKNRFVYWRGNKVWFSDPFQPELIYTYAVQTAYLGVFFDTGLTEDITAMSDLYASTLEEAGSSVLAIWTNRSMIMIQGEPATTIASTPEELFANCKVTRIPLTSGCVSQSSIVKTRHGLIWCSADSVWFMPKGNLPIEVGYKISPRIKAQAFESSGRIFATFDNDCYKLVINAPGVGYNPYEALNEMWCLSFIGDEPSKESAAWFGPQVFTNVDNPKVNADGSSINPPGPGGPSGLFCCAKLTNINDDTTWYIQPYSTSIGTGAFDPWGTRLGLASLSQYIGVDITAPYISAQVLDPTFNYSIGAVFQFANGGVDNLSSYATEYVATTGGIQGSGLVFVPIYCNEVVTAVWAKRPLYAWMELSGLLPSPYKIMIQSGNMTFDNPELVKMIDGYEITFKTLNPIVINSWWRPWEPAPIPANIVTLVSKSKVPVLTENMLGGLFNEPMLTARRVPSPANKRYNGISAQLNIQESDFKIIAAKSTLVVPAIAPPVGTPPTNWNYIRASTNNVNWVTFPLFDYDSEDIAKYYLILELVNVLQLKLANAIAQPVSIDPITTSGVGIKFPDGVPLYIDLSCSGWEWFGFVPTGLNLGWGVNIISNVANTTKYVYSTGPAPCTTPRDIHFAKLAARYRVLQARPR